MEEEQEPSLRHWERKLLIVAFGAWAGVVAIYGQAAVNRIDRVVGELEADRRAQAEYRTLMERRLTIVEQRQAYVIEALKAQHNGVVVP